MDSFGVIQSGSQVRPKAVHASCTRLRRPAWRPGSAPSHCGRCTTRTRGIPHAGVLPVDACPESGWLLRVGGDEAAATAEVRLRGGPGWARTGSHARCGGSNSAGPPPYLGALPHPVVPLVYSPQWIAEWLDPVGGARGRSRWSAIWCSWSAQVWPPCWRTPWRTGGTGRCGLARVAREPWAYGPGWRAMGSPGKPSRSGVTCGFRTGMVRFTSSTGCAARSRWPVAGGCWTRSPSGDSLTKGRSSCGR